MEQVLPRLQLSDRLGYTMLLKGVPGWVTEEGFQEAGRRMQMLDRQGHQKMRARRFRVYRASASLGTWTMVILPRVQEDVCCWGFSPGAEGSW